MAPLFVFAPLSSMAPNMFFHNLKQTIRATTQFIPCPVCYHQVRSRGGLTRHLNSVHPNFENNFTQDPDPTTKYQFIYTMNKTDQDKNYYNLWMIVALLPILTMTTILHIHHTIHLLLSPIHWLILPPQKIHMLKIHGKWT